MTTKKHACPACTAFLPEHQREAGSFSKSEMTDWRGTQLCKPCAVDAEQYRMRGTLPTTNAAVVGIRSPSQQQMMPTNYLPVPWEAKSPGDYATPWQGVIDAILRAEDADVPPIRYAQGERIREAAKVEKVRLARAQDDARVARVQAQLKAERAQLDKRIKRIDEKAKVAK